MQSKFRKRWRWLSLVLAVTFLLSSILPAGAASVLQPGRPPGDSSDIVPGEIVVKFRPGVETAGMARVSAIGAKKVASAQTGAGLYALPQGSAVRDVIKQLQADPNVAYAEPNMYRKLQTASSAATVSADTYIDQQWNLGAVNAQSAWSIDLTGSITVAVVDTGVDSSHPDLAGRVSSSGKNFVAKRSDGTAYGQDDASDDHGHGTHVAGVIAAVYGNGLGVAGVAGPAPVSVLPVKVLNNEGWGTSFDVSRGIVYAADQGAGVINLSLGGGYSSVEAEAVSYAQQKDCLVVAAAGNSNMNADNTAFPAALPGVLTVAATGQGNSRALFSNYGNCVEIAAPGVSILSTVPASVGGEVYESGAYYDSWSGTSMATPHVSAAAAMYLSKNSSASAQEVFDALTGTAADLGEQGRDPYFGYGLLNAAAALGFTPAQQEALRIIRPEGSDPVFGKIGLAARVAKPESVDHLQFYLDSEGTLLGKASRTAPATPQSVFELEWNSAARNDQGDLLYPDGEHQLIAIAYDSSGELGRTALPVRLKNSVETGLSFQVLDPKGQPASHAWMTVLLKRTFHYYGDYYGVAGESSPAPQSSPPGGGAYEGYYYETVANLPADADGRVRVPGTLAKDLNDFVVVVNGVFNDGGRDTSFLYQRRVEGPQGMVIDGANAVQTFLTAKNKDGGDLSDPYYRAALLDENGVAYMYASLSAGDSLSRTTAYVDKGAYDLFALSESSGGTYFLFRDGYKVENAGATVIFDGRNAGALKTSLSSGQKKSILYIMRENSTLSGEPCFGYSFGIAADNEVYLSAGRYYYDADVFQEDAQGTTWFYEMYKPEAVDLAEREVKPLSFGGNFASELAYPWSVNDTVYQDQELWVRNKFTDAGGHRLFRVEKNVAAPPDGAVLKLNLPGKPVSYSVPAPQGAWQAVANNGPGEPVYPYFTLQGSDDSVAAQTYGNFSLPYYVPLTGTAAGSYNGRLEAGIGPLASNDPLSATRPLTVVAAGETPAPASVTTVVYDLNGQPALNAELKLYRLRDKYSGYDDWWGSSYYSDPAGKITVPVDALTSNGDEPGRVNVAVVGYRTTGGDSVAVARAFRDAALPAEFLTGTTRSVIQTVYDHDGNPVAYGDPAVIFTPVLEGQSLPGLKVYPDHLGTNSWPNTNVVYLETGSYHFVSQFSSYTGGSTPPGDSPPPGSSSLHFNVAPAESYYLIAPNVQVTSDAQVTLDGQAAATLKLDVKGEGYLKEGGYWPQHEPLFIPFNQYDNCLEAMPFGAANYVTGGEIDYRPLADVVRADPERKQDLWNYFLAWSNGEATRFTVKESVYRSFGSEYGAALSLDKDLYTRVEDITGTSVFRDTYENKLIDLFVWNETFYDHNHPFADTADTGGQKPAARPHFSRRADGRVAVNALPEGGGWYEVNYVDPFLYFYSGTGAGAERVFKDSGYRYYHGFAAPAEKVGSTTGAYRAEVALGAGPAGPVRSPADKGNFTFSGGGVAVSIPEAVHADGQMWLAGRTFIVRGMADGGASVSLFVYQGDNPGASPNYPVTAGADGRFEQAVTVNADGQWNILAEQSDRGYQAIVTAQVDTAAPAAPTGLTAASAGDGRSVNLVWNQAAEAGLLARIERSAAGGGYSPLAEKIAGNTYADTGVQPGTGYDYRVTWVDRAGNASAYATASVSTSEPVQINSASVTAQKGPSGYLKPGKDLQVTARGTAGATAQAVAQLTKNGQAVTETITITETQTGGIYSGSLPIADGAAAAVQRIDVTLSKDGKTSRTLDALGGRPLNVGGTLAGTVTRNGEPVDNAQVGVFAPGGDGMSATTGQDGAFSFEGLRPGSYTLRVAKDDSTASAVYDLAAGAVVSGINLSLPERYDLTVEVKDKDGAEMDFSGLYVGISGQNLSRYEKVAKQTDGTFKAVFRNLPAGQYEWRTYGAGWSLSKPYIDSSGTVAVGANMDPLTVLLESLASRYGKITGKVLSKTDSSPIAGATVSAYSGKVWGGNSVQTDASGSFAIDMLTPADDYSLLASHPDYIEKSVQNLNVAAGANNAADAGDILLDPGCSVSGAVYGVDENNVTTPLADVPVYAYGGGTYRYVRTDGQGGYRIGGLPAGSYIVETYASRMGYRDKNAAVAVTDTIRDAAGNFTLSIMGSIDGTVRGQKETETNPLQYVYLNASGPSWGWARTGKNGYYIMRHLEAGGYNLNTHNYLGYVDQSASGITVADGRRSTRDFTLMSLEDAKKVFSGTGNGLTVSAPYAAPGERLTYRAAYKNNGTPGFTAENVTVTFDLPENATYVSGSLTVNGSVYSNPALADGKCTLDLGNVAAGDSGVIVYQADVSGTALDEAELVSRGTIAWQYNTSEGVKSEAQPLGLASTNLVFTTINAPAQTADGKVKVYGKSVPGAKIRIYDTYNGSEAVIGSAEAFGRWWNAELNLTGYGEHSLRAAADLNTRQSNPSTTVAVVYDTGVPVIDDVVITAAWNKDVHLNPYLGVAAMGITERYPISVEAVFNADSVVNSVYFMWLGSDSQEKRYDLTSSGGKWSVTTDYGWQDYGEKLITLIVKSGEKEYQFPLLLITVLIDPSGYVYEGIPSNRLAGVTAIVEEYKNGAWTPWNAAAFGQVNPQVTDDQGRYGWDVPAGTWRVLFSKDGFDTCNSYPGWDGKVPPPKMDLNVNMMNTAGPALQSAAPSSGATGVSAGTAVSVTFNKYMAVNSISEANFKLSKSDETPVTGTVAAQNAESGLAKTFVFTPSGALAAGSTYTVELAGGIVDYTGRSLAAQSWSFTTVSSGGGGGGGDSGTGPGGGGTSPGGGTPQPQDGQPVSQSVIASSGGTVATADQSVSLSIPAAALTADGTVKIAEVSGSAVPEAGNLSLGSKVFDITVENAALTRPVTLTFKYDTAKFSGVAADKIGIYYWNTARSSWIYIGGTVDTSGHVTASVNHFTKFAVMANGKLPALTDIGNHWAYHEIKRLVGMEVVNGYPDNTYRPDNNVTRAEFAKVVVEAMGWAPESGGPGFADNTGIPAWARGYIATAVDRGVIKGYEDNTFRAANLISRAEIAAMVVRAMGKESDAAKAGALSFGDAGSVPAWARGYVSVAAAQGIVKGKPGSLFAPADKATRAESAAMLVRMLNNLGI